MNKYNDGKIYKIIDNTNGHIYIGSTCGTLDKRLNSHKRDYRKFINSKSNFVTSFSIIENNDYIIELIELFPCNTRKELEAREGYHIRNNECVNKNIVGRTKKEYDKDNKEQKKQYYKANRDTIKEYKKQYYQINREKILQQRKEYYELKKNLITEINI